MPGQCVLTDLEHLVPTLEAAILLQDLLLANAAVRAVEDRLTTESCIGAWILATKLMQPACGALQELKTAAFRMCAERF